MCNHRVPSPSTCWYHLEHRIIRLSSSPVSVDFEAIFWPLIFEHKMQSSRFWFIESKVNGWPMALTSAKLRDRGKKTWFPLLDTGCFTTNPVSSFCTWAISHLLTTYLTTVASHRGPTASCALTKLRDGSKSFLVKCYGQITGHQAAARWWFLGLLKVPLSTWTAGSVPTCFLLILPDDGSWWSQTW